MESKLVTIRQRWAHALPLAAVQIAYLGFLPPTALLLFDAAVLVVAGELGRAHQPRPVPRHNREL